MSIRSFFRALDSGKLGGKPSHLEKLRRTSEKKMAKEKAVIWNQAIDKCCQVAYERYNELQAGEAKFEIEAIVNKLRLLRR